MAKKKAAKADTTDKAAEDAKARDEYNRGDFQTTDPVTGEPRGKMGSNWQVPDEDEDEDKPADPNKPDFD